MEFVQVVKTGGGISDPGLLPLLWARLRSGGRLVVNAVTTDGEARLLDWYLGHGGALTRIAISRAEPIGPHHLWRSLAPGHPAGGNEA